MFNIMEVLPVDLVGCNIFGFLSIYDLVKLERASTSKHSMQLFLHCLSHCLPVRINERKHRNIDLLKWCVQRRCRIYSLYMSFPLRIPVAIIKNLLVERVALRFPFSVTLEDCRNIVDSNLCGKVYMICLEGNQKKEVIQEFSDSINNIEELLINNVSIDNDDWLPSNIISRWKKLQTLSIWCVPFTLLDRLVHTTSILTSINLHDNVDEAIVTLIAQHCPQLHTLIFNTSKITYTCFLVLSEHKLPLKELDSSCIPHIPNANIAKRCSYALSCIRTIFTNNLSHTLEEIELIAPYLTGLKYFYLNSKDLCYISVFIFYCRYLTTVSVSHYHCMDYTAILTLCLGSIYLDHILFHCCMDITDTVLIELIHVCPHLHTLYLPYETDITNIGILALSERCPQLQWLNIENCTQVTEAAVLQLLQCCRKLTRLEVSSSSLSEETWTQLDKNTQKRVSLCDNISD